MTEFELKLQVPPDRIEAVNAAMGKGKGCRLVAIYFDTPERDLQSHGLVVRMRREGRDWIQTAKGDAGKVLERLEHNVLVPAADGDEAPPLDLTRHEGTRVGEQLQNALKRSGGLRRARLHRLFETDVQRLTRTEDEGGSTVEIAFDRGRITAGARSVPVCELEFELKKGSVTDAIELARRWTSHPDLWLSSISKSQRGLRLAAGGAAHGPAVLGRPPFYERDADAQEIAAQVVGTCLEQVLGNASEIAEGSTDAEHIHQLRVGIRRLRTAMREMRSLKVELGEQWEPVLIEVFRGLGSHRDYHHVALGLGPEIEKAGGPVVDVAQLAASLPDVGPLVRSPQFQDALLGLVGLAHSTRMPGSKRNPKPKKVLRAGLRKLYAGIVKDGTRFTSLDETQQHRVRKRVKRLRYLTEFVEPLFPGRRTSEFIEELKPVQDALGSYNDELMALGIYRELAVSQPNAWFGVGWLSARRDANAATCAKAVRRYSKAGPFWETV
jgi:triphosphatase